MPKYIQPIKVNGKRRYAVFSTITMSFHTKLYPNLKSIRKHYPKLPCKKKALLGRQGKNGSVEAHMKVYRISPKALEKYRVK